MSILISFLLLLDLIKHKINVLKEYSYFISYSYGNEKQFFGQVNLILQDKIKTYEDLEDVRLFISENFCNNELVVILNWKKF